MKLIHTKKTKKTQTTKQITPWRMIPIVRLQLYHAYELIRRVLERERREVCVISRERKKESENVINEITNPFPWVERGLYTHDQVVMGLHEILHALGFLRPNYIIYLSL